MERSVILIVFDFGLIEFQDSVLWAWLEIIFSPLRYTNSKTNHLLSFFGGVQYLERCLIPRHRKNSQSQCGKAVEYWSVFHRIFPSISVIQLYHTQPSHRSVQFNCISPNLPILPLYFLWRGIKQLCNPFSYYNHAISTCIFLVYTLA